MKVYGVREYGGEWEDKWESVNHIFASEEKAQSYIESEKKESEFLAQCKLCDRCKLRYDYKNISEEAAKKICDKFELDEDGDIVCEHYDYSTDETYYVIKEYEVE